MCILIELITNVQIFQIVKCIRDRRRRLRHRLSSRHLKQIPTAKFKKGMKLDVNVIKFDPKECVKCLTGDQYDTCAVCLEEYVEGEKLRILPCGHGISFYKLKLEQM